MAFDLEAIEQLVDLATSKGLSELTVEEKDRRITVKTALSAPAASTVSSTVAVMPQAVNTETTVSTIEVKSEPVNNYYKVVSPMVGTFYSAPSPDAPTYVEVGSQVSVGQTLCIIEAMKLMNELECEVNGTVKRIVAQNGKPVEFGQVLMEIEVS